MASYTVNRPGAAQARKLINAKQYVLDSEWGDVQPKAASQNAFLKEHSWPEYSAWFLGLTDGAADDTKARYAFVYGDFRRLHRSGLIAPSTGPLSGVTRRSSEPRTGCYRSSTPRPPSRCEIRPFRISRCCRRDGDRGPSPRRPVSMPASGGSRVSIGPC